MNYSINIPKLFNAIFLIKFLILLIIAFVLLIIIWIKYSRNFESFKSLLKDTYSPETSHNVNMPLNTTFSCKNVCGPLSRCSITGEQCTSDIDCFGCTPSQSFETHRPPILLEGFGFRGQNEAGKLTTNVVPRYSSLTTDIGTNAKLYNYKLIDVPKAQYGLNTWLKSFDAGLQIYKKKYAYEKTVSPEDFKYIPKYPLRVTTTGLYKTDDALASNDFL